MEVNMAEQTAVPNTAAAVAKAKKLEQELAKLREQSKTEIVGLIETHIGELAELGFHYELVEKNGGSKTDKTCGKCGKAGHNARSCPGTPAPAEPKKS